MTQDERERMNGLCKRIQDGKNPVNFDRLVQELLALTEVKQKRIHSEHNITDPQNPTAAARN